MTVASGSHQVRRQHITFVLIVLAGLLVRAWAAWLLPVDADEPVYLRAASAYAQALRAGGLQGIINSPENPEHPPLVKLLYSLGYLVLPVRYDALYQLYAARALSVFFGTLTVALAALFDPIAGLFLALHSMTIKYTAEAYLEALPQFTALLAVLALRRARQGDRRAWWVSAVALGATAAGKLTYLVVLPALAVLLWEQRPWERRRLAGYIALALGTFWLLTPSLWTAPLARLKAMLTFHIAYTHSSAVMHAAYPWYQPLLWIINDVPWHPHVFFFFTFDRYVIWFLVPGLVLAWKRRESWASVWFISALVTLLVWPTKWPQYTLTLTVPLCLLSALALRALITWARAMDEYWGWFDSVFPRPPRWAIAVAVIFITGLTLGQVSYEVEMAQGRRGWSQFTRDTAPLLSDTIYDVAVGQDGRIALASDSGLTFWTPGQNFLWDGGVEHWTPANSPLPTRSVVRVLAAQDGSWWLGTEIGLVHYTGSRWEFWGAEELGLPAAQVRALWEDASGQLWVGTLRGATRGQGQAWQALPELGDQAVFAITERDGEVWFGTEQGISRYDRRSQIWSHLDRKALGLNWGGVVDLLVASDGTIWAATQGDGALHGDGLSWEHFTVRDGLPANTLRCFIELEDGTLWIGAGYPTEPGGLIITWDGTRWRKLTPRNSGYAGSEPLNFARDAQGGLWIATATDGVQYYRLNGR